MSESDTLASTPNGGPGDPEVAPTLVTGFGPFGSVAENPSAALAALCGLPFRVLEVSFAAVDEFVGGLDPSSFERLLLIGVHGGTDTMRLETVARNEIGEAPDVRGVVAGPGPIDPRLPRRLAGSLWKAPAFLAEDPRWEVATDAGTYLCNYIFFRALSAYPDKQVGFLHVPTFERVSQDEQSERLRAILEVLSAF